MFRSLVVIVVASIVFVKALHNDRIVNGREAFIENFPHQISLRYKGNHTCGGSIISPTTVITAAHCVERYRKYHLTVLAGVTNRHETLVTSKNASIHEVNGIIMHPGYDEVTNDCDVAFLQLKDPIVFRSTAQPIPIAPVSAAPKHGDILVATGWGLTKKEGEDLSDVLRSAVLPVINLKLCIELYRNYSSFGNTLTENMFCAGGSVNGQATYRGDSGGPVINSERQLVGVTSWGKYNDPLGFPKVFANLSSPRIRSFMETVLSQI